MSNITICKYLCGSAPFKEKSKEGMVCSKAKHVVIGLIVGGALAAGIYFAQMALYTVWNPFNASLATQMGLTITVASLGGIFATLGIIFSMKAVTQCGPLNLPR